MLGIDTNSLVRFLVRDDAEQFEIVHQIVEREVLASRRVFVSQFVLQEMEWVLRSRYGFSKPQIQGVVSGLLDSMDFELEDEAAVEQAICKRSHPLRFYAGTGIAGSGGSSRPLRAARMTVPR